jgi:hypothetical protein
MPAAWIVLVLVLWLVVVLLVVVVVGLIRRVGEFERISLTNRPTRPRVVGPAVGSRLPAVLRFERVLATGEGASRQLVLFLNSSCGPCAKLAGELRTIAGGEADGGERLRGGGRLVVVSDPDGVASFADLGASDMIAQADGELSRAWGIPGTPFVVAVDESGVVLGSAFASTLEQLCEVAGTLAGEPIP